ncbi:WD repeat-containing protein 18-like [Lineus longissimus]|uniref:WD repeat-containing protein 18-like n=1 Tax=Lineus longissimus TaxID=88925 RepID=UPI002B4C779A
MAAPMEVILTSDVTGQMWNTCVWDANTGTALSTFKGDTSSSRTLCVVNGEYLMSAVNNKPLLHVWTLHRKDQQKIVCPGKVSSLAVSPDGHYCVAGISEKIHIWQVSTGHLLVVLSRHYQTVTQISFTDDGSHFITAGDDNMVMLWELHRVISQEADPHQTEPKFTFPNHSLPVTDIHCGYGGPRARLVTASSDQTCKLWDLATGKLLCSFLFDEGLTAVCMDSCESRLFAATSKGVIHQVNLFERGYRPEASIPNAADDDALVFLGHTKQVTCLSLSLDGIVLVSGSNDCTVKIWDAPSRQCLRTLLHKGAITNAVILPTPRGLQSQVHPSFPIQPFKRHMYNVDEVVEDSRGIVVVRQAKMESDEQGEVHKVANILSHHKRRWNEIPSEENMRIP